MPGVGRPPGAWRLRCGPAQVRGFRERPCGPVAGLVRGASRRSRSACAASRSGDVADLAREVTQQVTDAGSSSAASTRASASRSGAARVRARALVDSRSRKRLGDRPPPVSSTPRRQQLHASARERSSEIAAPLRQQPKIVHRRRRSRTSASPPQLLAQRRSSAAATRHQVARQSSAAPGSTLSVLQAAARRRGPWRVRDLTSSRGLTQPRRSSSHHADICRAQTSRRALSSHDPSVTPALTAHHAPSIRPSTHILHAGLPSRLTTHQHSVCWEALLQTSMQGRSGSARGRGIPSPCLAV